MDLSCPALTVTHGDAARSAGRLSRLQGFRAALVHALAAAGLPSLAAAGKASSVFALLLAVFRHPLLGAVKGEVPG